MKSKHTHTLDLTRGLYRRIYDGFRAGKRINSVSVSAEALFWRIMVSTDDFGNMPGDPLVIKAVAAPKRDWTIQQVAKLVDELAAAKLITKYAVEGDDYIHVNDFELTQPANRNGRRLQRVPLMGGNPGESEGIQNNPDASPGNPGESKMSVGESCASDSDSDSDSDSESKSASAIAAARARPSSVDEVAAYGKDIGLPPTECERFFDHFTANGWRQGGRAAMKDWRAALRNWKRRAGDFGGPSGGVAGPSPPGGGIDWEAKGRRMAAMARTEEPQ